MLGLISPKLLGLKTWTERRPVTHAALAGYCDEPIAIITEDMWTKLTGDLCPAGVDGQKLADMLTLVTG